MWSPFYCEFGYLYLQNTFSHAGMITYIITNLSLSDHYNIHKKHQSILKKIINVIYYITSFTCGNNVDS